MKKYRFGFDIWGFALFLLIMVPNFIWFAVPAPDDILRAESITPVLDIIASVVQVVMIICLCIFKNSEAEKLRVTGLIVAAAACVLLYFLCWMLYYKGMTNAPVLLGLAAFPCIAFLLYSADRKNLPALILVLIFTACHIISVAINFII